MKVLVLGGGIAGLATALALAQRGHAVTVLERRVRHDGMGAGVVLWPNACAVLERLGLLATLAPLSGRPRAMQRFSPQGELLHALDLQRAAQSLGYTSLSVLRPVLMSVLLHAASRWGVTLKHGVAVDRVVEGGALRPTVQMADG